MLANIKPVTLPQFGDDRGKLVVLQEFSDFVPFQIRRSFFIFDIMPGTVRGSHAHIKNRQMLVCVSGACTIKCEMPDGTKSSWRLDWPDKGLLVEGLVWHTMEDFSKDAVLLVIASELYDEADYIRDYAEFKRLVATQAKGEHAESEVSACRT